MSAQPIPARCLSPEDYFRLEADSVEKHEYWDGKLINMAGGSATHSLIIANLIRRLGNRLDGSPCRVYDSNLRVRAASSTRYTYPDATIICGPPQFDPQDRAKTTITNPRIIIEVFSPSTIAHDQRDKFPAYLEIESMQECVMVFQTTAIVQTFLRREEGTWLMTHYKGLDAEARLASVNVALPLAEIYSGVEFPPVSDELAELLPM